MRAIVIEEKGQPFVLREVQDPIPSPGEKRIRLKAASLNHRDAWIRKGQYAGLKFPLIPGSDGAGILEESGEAVLINPSMNWGEKEAAQSRNYKILGLPDSGTFAEMISVPSEYIFPVPPHLDFQHAAALPLAGLTAWRALHSRARLQEGESVLITGIGGGVALFALQFALGFAGKVFVSSGSDEKIGRAIQMGAAGGVNYKNANWHESLKEMAGGFDVIIDGAAGEGAGKFPDLANPGGRIVFYGGTVGPLPSLSPQKIFWKQLSLMGSTMGSPADFSAMLDYVSRTSLVPIVDEIFPLDQTEKAIQKMESGNQFGKIVLEI